MGAIRRLLTMLAPASTASLQIIEVERPKVVLPPAKEFRESLVALQTHPGMQYLLDRLRFQRYVLETKLRTERAVNLRDIEFLQSGLFWCNWLEQQLNLLTQNPQPAPVAATQTELDIFNEVYSQLEKVGAPAQPES